MIKRTLSVILVTVLLAGTVSMAHSGAADNSNATEDSYLVLTSSSQALETVKETTDDYDHVLTQKGGLKTVSAVELTKAEAAELKDTDGVLSVEKDITLSGSGTPTKAEETEIEVTDFLFKDVDSDDINQWYLDAVGTDSVEDGDKVKIELLDSGVNLSQDIKVKSRINLISENNFNPMYEDFSGHGTSMASVISSKDNGKNVTGLNPNADLYSVRVLDDNIQAPLSRIVEGIRWGIDNDMDIINMSFGTSVNSAVLRSVIEEADRAGILLISATGNQSKKGVQYPAAYPQVLAVGSMDENSQISDFTSVGKEMDVVAPGEKIETNGIFGTIKTADGTSIATAEVSAAASKLLEKDKTKSPDFIKKLIKASAKRITDSGVVTGAVDSDYALEIYDEFEKTYTQNPETEEYTNTEEPEIFDTDGVVEGLWTGDEHKKMVGTSIDKTVQTRENLVKQDIELIKLAAIYPDTHFLKVAALHGGGNYVANINIAWRFINILSERINHDDSSAESGESIIDTAERIAKSEKEGSGSLACSMLECMKKMKNISLIEEKNTYKNLLYKCIGLFIHMVGDTFAHRTQVPRSYNQQSRFSGEYFSDNILNQTLSQEGKNELIDIVQNNSEYDVIPTYYRYRADLVDAISFGICEFRDIKRFWKEYYIKNENYDEYRKKVSKVCSLYEDNRTFYKRRLDEVYKRCSEILTNSWTKKLKLAYLTPSVENNTSVKLYDYKNYAKKAGFNIKEMDDNGWNRCTCYPIDVK